jgi:hypothetical protein
MAITTYSELQTAVSSWLNRSDLNAVVPDFISLAEADINRRLRHWRMQVRATAQIDGQYSAFPNNWVEAIRFQITDGTPSELELLPQAEIVDRREDAANIAGRPRFYAITGSQFEFFPTPDGTYNAELVYFGKVPALSVSAPTNWLLSDHPDVYLYGSLVHSAPYLSDDARAQVWAALYQSALDGANLASDNARHSGTGLRMKIRSY